MGHKISARDEPRIRWSGKTVRPGHHFPSIEQPHAKRTSQEVGVAELISVEFRQETRTGFQGENIAHDTTRIVFVEERGRVPAHIIEATGRTALPHKPRLRLETPGHGMSALRTQRAIDEDVRRLTHLRQFNAAVFL